LMTNSSLTACCTGKTCVEGSVIDIDLILKMNGAVSQLVLQ
jgi:hypothetical protein